MPDTTQTHPLPDHEDLCPGAHLVTQRRGYTHHGIYAGHGIVIHYAGLSRGLRRGPVQAITLADFAAGRPVREVRCAEARYAGKEAVRRACLRLGEDAYRLTTNNCEHFCMWCLHGESRSVQVETWIAPFRRMLDAVRPLLGTFVAPPDAWRPDCSARSRPLAHNVPALP